MCLLLGVTSITAFANNQLAITEFTLNGYKGTIVEGADGQISVVVPPTADVTKMIAKFNTNAKVVTVGARLQSSGVTSNNFTYPVYYQISDDLGQHGKIIYKYYLVTVKKPVTEFALNNFAGTVDHDRQQISVLVPDKTDVTKMVAKFSSAAKVVLVNGQRQYSGETIQNFTHPVTYTFQYEFGPGDIVSMNYVVTVTRTAFPQFEFAIDGYHGKFNGNNIEVKLPRSYNLSQLKATFNSNFNVLVNGKEQLSGVTVNDFSNSDRYPLEYQLLTNKGIFTYYVKVNTVDNPSGSDSNMHENEFRFFIPDSNNTIEPSVKKIDLVYHSSIVTTGQRSNVGFDFNQFKDNTLKIIFNSGRKKSEDIAKEFKKFTEGRTLLGHCRGSCGEVTEPKELNFLITTMLYINDSPVKGNLYIAQGSNVLGNNWWIGGDQGGFENVKNSKCDAKVTTMNNREYYISVANSWFSISSESNSADGCYEDWSG